METAFQALREIPPPFNMVVWVMLIVFTFGLAGKIVKQIRVFFDHEADRRLKRDLFETGCSADEMETIAKLKVTDDYKGKSKQQV